MSIKEKVTEKEKSVKGLFEQLRNCLNGERIKFDKDPNGWSYITSLTHSETKLKELIAYFETAPK